MILRYIADNGPANKYHICHDLSKTLDVSNNLVLYSILDLEKNGSITVHHSQPARGKEKSSNYYELSSGGLRALIIGLDSLGLPQSDVNHLYRRLAQKYYELYPCVFRFWPDIVNAGVEELAQRRCLHLTQTIHDSPDWLPDRHSSVNPEEHVHYKFPEPHEKYAGDRSPEAQQKWYKHMRELLLDTDPHYRIFLDPFEHETNDADREKWLSFVTGNPQLRRQTAMILEGTVMEYVDNANKILEFIMQPTFEPISTSDRAELEEKVAELEQSLHKLRQR